MILTKYPCLLMRRHNNVTLPNARNGFLIASHISGLTFDVTLLLRNPFLQKKKINYSMYLSYIGGPKGEGGYQSHNHA